MTRHSWFREICEKTTSHCMQYFVMQKRSLAEKFFWILVFFCMASIAFSALSLLFNTWMYRPTVMFVENTESEIQEIPFPAITICSSNQLRKSIWGKHENMKDTYWKNLQQYRSSICNLHTYNLISKKYTIKYYDYKLFKSLMMNCAISCSEVFQFPMQWENITISNVCSYVQPMVTVRGLCYSINKIPSYEMFNEKFSQRYNEFFSKNNTYSKTERMYWNMDDGYIHYSQNNVSLDLVPARMNGVTLYNRLKLTLYSMENEFLKCPDLTFADGYFFVVISNPANHFLYDKKYIVIPETHTKFQIRPIVKKIRSNLMWRSLEVRKCYLHNERKLYIFQQYTEENCFSECSINETITTCECIFFEAAFLAPGMKVCGPEKIECVNKARQITMDIELIMKCNCLPTCSMVDYDVTASSNIDSWDYLKITNLSTNKSRGATVEFAFKYPHFSAYEIASILSFSTLISTVGGILSLILGLNLLNIFEILYVIMKMIYNYVIHMFDK